MTKKVIKFNMRQIWAIVCKKIKWLQICKFREAHRKQNPTLNKALLSSRCLYERNAIQINYYFRTRL